MRVRHAISFKKVVVTLVSPCCCCRWRERNAESKVESRRSPRPRRRSSSVLVQLSLFIRSVLQGNTQVYLLLFNFIVARFLRETWQRALIAVFANFSSASCAVMLVALTMTLKWFVKVLRKFTVCFLWSRVFKFQEIQSDPEVPVKLLSGAGVDKLSGIIARDQRKQRALKK